MLVSFLHLTKRVLWKQYQDLSGKSYTPVDNWAIGVIQEPATELINQSTPLAVSWIVPPEGRYYADPFAIVKDGITYIFFEDYNYRTQLGHIAVIETTDFKEFSEARPVLEQPFNLSYPYVFEHEGCYYCVPEQSQSGEVALYEAESFPGGWAKRATLLDGFPGVDPTLVQYQGLWWMFLGHKDNDYASNLYIFFAEDFWGPWHPHPNNPVRVATGLVRPGGTPFLCGDRLLRPTQDGSMTYGGGIIVNEITVINRDEFEEQVFTKLVPIATSPYREGLHTLTAVGNLTLVDGKRFMPGRLSSSKALAGKLKAVGRLLQGKFNDST